MLSTAQTQSVVSLLMSWLLCLSSVSVSSYSDSTSILTCGTGHETPRSMGVAGHEIFKCRVMLRSGEAPLWEEGWGNGKRSRVSGVAATLQAKNSPASWYGFLILAPVDTCGMFSVKGNTLVFNLYVTSDHHIKSHKLELLESLNKHVTAVAKKNTGIHWNERIRLY